MSRPRLCALEHSATHDGMVDVLAPFPTPVMMRPIMNCRKPFLPGMAVTWMTVPMHMIWGAQGVGKSELARSRNEKTEGSVTGGRRTKDPSHIILRRPSGSAMKKAAMAPKKQPTSYTAVTVPWIVAVWTSSGPDDSVCLKSLLNTLAVMMPAMTPWS